MTELHKRSKAQEQRTAKALGGRTQPRSGAGWAAKNDVLSDRFLVECKRTDNKTQITLKAVDLEGLARNAANIGKEPLLSLELHGRDYVVIDQTYLEELLCLIDMGCQDGPTSSSPKKTASKTTFGRPMPSASVPLSSPIGSSFQTRTTPRPAASPPRPSTSATGPMGGAARHVRR